MYEYEELSRYNSLKARAAGTLYSLNEGREEQRVLAQIILERLSPEYIEKMRQLQKKFYEEQRNARRTR